MTKPALKFVYENESGESRIVIVEPWAEEFTVPPRSRLEVHVLSQRVEALHTQAGEDCFSVWVWSGCRAEVFMDGNDVTTKNLSIPVP